MAILTTLIMASLPSLFSLFLYNAIKNNFHQTKKKFKIYTIDLPPTLIAAFLVVFVFFTILSTPSFLDSLSPTNAEVTNHKNHMRNLCIDYKERQNEEEKVALLSPLLSLDPSFSLSPRRSSNPLLANEKELSMARQIVGNNIIGKTLARLRPSPSTLSSLGNTLIASLGPLLPILPFLFYSFFYLVYGALFQEEEGVFLPLRLTLCVGVSIGSFVNFILFNYFLDRLRAVWCVHISGHWYTYTVTTFVFATTFTHLINHRRPHGLLPSFYILYSFVYQYLVLVCCLSETQEFFHDQIDAQTGLWCGCMVGIPVFIFSFFIGNKLIIFMNGKRGGLRGETEKKGKEIEEEKGDFPIGN